jgi:hypothetical protein
MLQHSRIRATYDIDGTTADDCYSAYCCPCCTIMQDDREIRAREYKDRKNEKKCGAINDQPPAQPDMQYAASHLFVDEPVQQCGSLVREKPTTTVTGQSQSSRGHGPKGENQQGLNTRSATMSIRSSIKLLRSIQLNINLRKRAKWPITIINEMFPTAEAHALTHPHIQIRKREIPFLPLGGSGDTRNYLESKKDTLNIQITQATSSEVVRSITKPTSARRYFIILKMHV